MERHERAAALTRGPLDGALELATHHLMDDLRAQATHRRTRHEAHAIVCDGHRHGRAQAFGAHLDKAITVREAMLDRVGD